MRGWSAVQNDDSIRRLGARACLLVVLVGVALGSTGTPQARANEARLRCSFNPQIAAAFVIPPLPFKARLVSVRRWKLPPAEPVGRGPSFKRLYLVTFYVVRGNPVLPGGHRYSQFAYVTRKSLSAPWCFSKGGSGP